MRILLQHLTSHAAYEAYERSGRDTYQYRTRVAYYVFVTFRFISFFHVFRVLLLLPSYALRSYLVRLTFLPLTFLPLTYQVLRSHVSTSLPITFLQITFLPVIGPYLS